MRENSMPQFSIKLPDNVLMSDTIASVSTFAKRTDWTGLPYSTQRHAWVIGVILHPPGTDTSIAEEGLHRLASLRMLFYLDSPNRLKTIDEQLWSSWIDRIQNLAVACQREDSAAIRLQLYKDRMKMSIELTRKATELFHNDSLSSEVLYASAQELGEAAEIQTINESDERIKSALAVANIAKQYSFEEHSEPPPPSLWEKVKSVANPKPKTARSKSNKSSILLEEVDLTAMFREQAESGVPTFKEALINVGNNVRENGIDVTDEQIRDEFAAREK